MNIIEINLLNTIGEGPKNRKGFQDKFWLVLLVAIFIEVAIIFGLSVFEKAKIRDLEEKKTYLSSFLVKVKMIKKKELEEKRLIRTISELEKGKNLPVRILYTVANATPNKIWITRLNKQQKTLNITAESLDIDSISLFMNNLSKEDIIKDVKFNQGVTKSLDKEQNIYQFSLNCELR